MTQQATEMKTTKQLARELGILREKKLSKTSCGKHGEKKQCQEFNYLIVIDFESTCWERDKTKTQEIIEFPAVLLNTRSGEIESEFHYYVQPQEHPTLSVFCHKLTGISQDQVEDGVPLSLCLRKFSQWCHTLWQEKSIRLAGDRGTDSADQAVNLAAIVTWSDWDLGVCLHYELRRKQISKAPCFNEWIDLRATYTKFYGRKPKGLNGALQDVGIEFEGRQHSGLDDSRNTAMLAWRMIRDGCVLSITKSLNPASANVGGPAPQTKREIPQTLTEKTVTKPQGNSPACLSHEKLETITTTKPGTSFFSSTAGGLRMRNPNVLESSTTERKNTETTLKRPAAFTPEKSSIKCPTVSPPKRNAGKTSPGRVKIQSAREKPAESFKTPHVTPSTNTGSLRTPHVTPSTNTRSLRTQHVTPSTNTGSLRTPHMTPSTNTGSLRTPHVTPSTNTGSLRTPHVTPSTNTDSFKTPETGVTLPTYTRFRTSQNGVTPSTNTRTPHETPSTNPRTPHETPSTNTGLFRTPQTGVTTSTGFKTPHVTPTNTRTPHVTPPTNTGSFQTPQNSVTPSTNTGSFQTPQNPSATSLSTMKATPPLCKCGRRAKRRLVQSPGPNQGRWFFSCIKGTASTAPLKSIGCGFFQWEHCITMSTARSFITPTGRQTSPSVGRAAGMGVGAGRPFTPVLQAPVASRGQKRLGVSSLSACVLR